MFVVFVWQIPLILLSGAAALMSRFRGATIIAVGMGALTHLVIGLWGGWVILTSHDAQASIGIFFVPVYLGMGSWSVAILSFVAASLLISVRGSRLGAG